MRQLFLGQEKVREAARQRCALCALSSEGPAVCRASYWGPFLHRREDPCVRDLSPDPDEVCKEGWARRALCEMRREWFAVRRE